MCLHFDVSVSFVILWDKWTHTPFTLNILFECFNPSNVLLPTALYLRAYAQIDSLFLIFA